MIRLVNQGDYEADALDDEAEDRRLLLLLVGILVQDIFTVLKKVCLVDVVHQNKKIASVDYCCEHMDSKSISDPLIINNVLHDTSLEY